MSILKAVIMAGGSKKFDRNTIFIGGETLIERTTRLLRKHGVDDITITVSPNFAGEMVKGVDYVINNETGNDMGCVWGAGDKHKKSLFLFGDVYFTEEAIKTIVKGETSFYGKSGEGKLKKHGEMFAIKSDSSLWEKMIELKGYLEKGEIPLLYSWTLYSFIQGKDFYTHGNTGNFTEILDETDDFDTEEEYQTFLHQ